MAECKCIRCTDYTSRSLASTFYISYSMANEKMIRCQNVAKKILNESGADHVLYGLKVYGSEGNIETIQYYSLAMNDIDFKKLAARCRSAVVYALHRRKP